MITIYFNQIKISSKYTCVCVWHGVRVDSDNNLIIFSTPKNAFVITPNKTWNFFSLLWLMKLLTIPQNNHFTSYKARPGN